jgi:hypothetical protein
MLYAHESIMYSTVNSVFPKMYKVYLCLLLFMVINRSFNHMKILNYVHKFTFN